MPPGWSSVRGTCQQDYRTRSGIRPSLCDSDPSCPPSLLGPKSGAGEGRNKG